MPPKKKPCHECQEAKQSHIVLKQAVQQSLQSGFLKQVRAKAKKQRQQANQKVDPLASAREAVLKDAFARNTADENKRQERQFQEEQRRYLKEQDQKQTLALNDLSNKLQIDLTALKNQAPPAPPLFPQLLNLPSTNLPSTNAPPRQRQHVQGKPSKAPSAPPQSSPPSLSNVKSEPPESGPSLSDKDRQINFDSIKDLFEKSLKSEDDNVKLLLPKYFGIQNINLPSNASFDNILQVARDNTPDFDRRNAKLIKIMQETKHVKNPAYTDILALSKKLSRLLNRAKKGAGLSTNPDTNLLYDDEIADYMRPLEKLGFIGVFMSDEIRGVPSNQLQKRGSLIMNVQPSQDSQGHQNPGEHWVSLFWDLRHKNEGNYTLHWEEHPHNQGVFYYDPFGRAPSDQMLKDIKVFLDKIIKKFDIDYQIEFQHNTCKNQDLRSFECGYFAMAWLIDMYNGFDPNIHCCRYHQDETTRADEHKIKEFQEKIKHGVPVNKIKDKIL